MKLQITCCKTIQMGNWVMEQSKKLPQNLDFTEILLVWFENKSLEIGEGRTNFYLSPRNKNNVGGKSRNMSNVLSKWKKSSWTRNKHSDDSLFQQIF